MVKLAKNYSKIDKSFLGDKMAAIHTASTVDREVLQKQLFQELEYSSVHKYVTLL